jgi:glyoxylase-like metal-dependent hydrolase (beta-lactamase superfamily II)
MMKRGIARGLFFFLFLLSLFLFSSRLSAVGEVRDGYESFDVSDGLTVTALSDSSGGSMPFSLFHGASAEDLRKISEEAGLGGNHFVSWINAFLVSYGGKKYLVDAGMGATDDLIDRLKASGTDPSEVDFVLITHFHGDHIGGLIDEAGKAAFPNAILFVPMTDENYFIPASGPGVGGTALARKVTAPYVKSGSFVSFGDGEKAGDEALSKTLFGHTPGHTGYLFEGDKDTLLLWGDIVHSYLVQFKRPKVTLTYDVSEPEAAKTRAAMLEEAVQKKYLIAGAHLPFPGIGRVEKDGDAYKWVPLGEDK